MTSNLTTKLAEALAMNEERLSTIIRQTNWNGPLQCDGFARGMRSTHDSLQPLHKLLVELASAADRLGNCCAEFDDLHYCAEYFQALDDKVQALRTQLSKEGV